MLSLDIRSLRERTGDVARRLALYHVILCCVEVDYTIDEARAVTVTGARRALPEAAWEAAQAAVAAGVRSGDDDDNEEDEARGGARDGGADDA